MTILKFESIINLVNPIGAIIPWIIRIVYHKKLEKTIETEEVLMKIIIEGSAEEIFDFVGEIQSRILNSYASADGINLYEAVQQAIRDRTPEDQA